MDGAHPPRLETPCPVLPVSGNEVQTERSGSRFTFGSGRLGTLEKRGLSTATPDPSLPLPVDLQPTRRPGRDRTRGPVARGHSKGPVRTQDWSRGEIPVRECPWRESAVGVYPCVPAPLSLPHWSGNTPGVSVGVEDPTGVSVNVDPRPVDIRASVDTGYLAVNRAYTCESNVPRSV